MLRIPPMAPRALRRARTRRGRVPAGKSLQMPLQERTKPSKSHTVESNWTAHAAAAPHMWHESSGVLRPAPCQTQGARRQTTWRGHAPGPARRARGGPRLSGPQRTARGPAATSAAHPADDGMTRRPEIEPRQLKASEAPGFRASLPGAKPPAPCFPRRTWKREAARGTIPSSRRPVVPPSLPRSARLASPPLAPLATG